MTAAHEANQREIARLQAYVDRFGAKTMGAVKGQEYLRQIEKLEKNGPPPPTSLADAGPAAPIRFPVPPRGSQRLLELSHVDIVWQAPELKVAPQAVVSDVSFTIERGMRVVVRGPNGAGKSTVLSALSGALAVAGGQRHEGDGLKIGAFTQDLAQDLDQVPSFIMPLSATSHPTASSAIA